jgi:hypothetical protein
VSITVDWEDMEDRGLIDRKEQKSKRDVFKKLGAQPQKTCKRMFGDTRMAEFWEDLSRRGLGGGEI